MRIIPSDEPFIWLPKSQKQLQMTAEEIRVDNYCRDILQILNKATPQNVDTLLEKMSTININNEFNINKLAHFMVQKAVDEPIYSEVYSEMCCSLNQFIGRMTSGQQNTETLCGLFKKLVTNQCEIQFNLIFNERVDPDILMERNDDFSVKNYNYFHRQKMFGNIVFIGELFKTEFVSLEKLTCLINKLLEKTNDRRIEFQVECFCKLMRIVGETLECLQKRTELLDEYFSKLNFICQEIELCSRVKFAVMDLNEIRGNNWVGRPIIQKPITIDEIRNSNTAVVKRRKKKKN